MRGWRLFLAKVRVHPWRALAGLALDYLTFVAMVAFFILLWALRWPIALVESLGGRGLRGALIHAVASVAHG